MSALIILWSQVQVLVGPPEKQTLVSNSGVLSINSFGLVAQMHLRMTQEAALLVKGIAHSE